MNRGTVLIYFVESGTGYTSFVISCRENSSRKRQGFTTIIKAGRAAKNAAWQIASGHAQSVKLKPEAGKRSFEWWKN